MIPLSNNQNGIKLQAYIELLSYNNFMEKHNFLPEYYELNVAKILSKKSYDNNFYVLVLKYHLKNIL